MDHFISLSLLITLISLGSTSPIIDDKKIDLVKSDEYHSPSKVIVSDSVKPSGYVESDVPSLIIKPLISDEVKLEAIDLASPVDLIEVADKSPAYSSVGDEVESKKEKVTIKLYSKYPTAVAVDSEPVTSQPVKESREEVDDQLILANSAEEKKHSEIVVDSGIDEIKEKVTSDEEKNNLQPLHYAVMTSTDATRESVNTELPQSIVSNEKVTIVKDEVKPNVSKTVASVENLSPLTSAVASISVGINMVKSSSIPAKYGPGVKPTEVSELIADSVDQATKLLIDLEEQVKVYLNTEDESISGSQSTSVPLVYGAESSNIALPVVKEITGDLLTGEVSPVAEEENINKQGASQIQSMIDEVNRVAQNVESVISELVSSRRYVTAAVFRSLLNYLRRVRISLERLQNRMQTIGVGSQPNNVSAETAAIASSLSESSSSSSSSSSTSTGSSSVANITSGYLDAIRDRIYRITDEIRTLISRLRLTFSPTPSSSSSQVQ